VSVPLHDIILRRLDAALKQEKRQRKSGLKRPHSKRLPAGSPAEAFHPCPMTSTREKLFVNLTKQAEAKIVPLIAIPILVEQSLSRSLSRFSSVLILVSIVVPIFVSLDHRIK